MQRLGTGLAVLAMVAGAEAAGAQAAGAQAAAVQGCRIDLPAGFSGAAALGGGEAPVVATAGFRDAAGKVRIDPDTRLNLGSVNKMMTAIAVGQLVEEGRLGFDDPVGRHLPGLPDDIAALRVRDLLSHRAGLPLFLRPQVLDAVAKAPDARALVPLVLAEPREAPGPFRYSNAGFVLVGAMVEELSGLSYGRYLETRILRPAGIASRGLAWREGDAEGRGGADAEAFARLPAWPAGSLMLSAPDLWRFGRALAEGRLVSRPTLEAMTRVDRTAREPDGSPAPGYGLGMGVTDRNGRRVVGHSGGAAGVDASIRIALDTGAVAVALQNQEGTNARDAHDLTRELLLLAEAGCAPGQPISAARPPRPGGR